MDLGIDAEEASSCNDTNVDQENTNDLDDVDDNNETQTESGDGEHESPKSFLATIARVEIALILVVSFILSISVGGVIGIVPDTISDRYARLHHGYNGPGCGSLETKPEACQAGTDDAQAAAAWSNVGLCVFGLLLNPLVGGISDSHGRRCSIIASLFVCWLSSLLFLQTISSPRMNPIWFYISQSVIGGFQFVGLVFAALSDIVPEAYRAGSFGVFVGTFYGGFAIAPSIPLWLNHQQTCIVCFGLSTLALIVAVLFLPETLSVEIQQSNRQQPPPEVVVTDNQTKSGCRMQSLLKPIRELSILNRTYTLRLVAIGSLISSMVYASDATLVLFYAEDRFAFGDADIATMFMTLGIIGVLLQGIALQPLTQCVGENKLLVLTFACGSLHNLLYGVARSKETIFVAVILSQFTKVNSPVLASFASKLVPKTEQGRIQGALSACLSIGSAAGPLSMEYIYHHTKNNERFGPGFMFIYASLLYAVGTAFIALLPRKTPAGEAAENDSENSALAQLDSMDNLETPLLQMEEGA